MSALQCPNCGRRAKEGDFLCPACETILDADQLLEEDFEPPREPTVIRRMLAPPESSLHSAAPQPPEELREPAKGRRGNTKTRLFVLPFETTDVPRVILGLDLKAKSLSSFEAYVVSMVDGRSSIDELRMVTGLSKIEIQSILRSLHDRKVLEVGPRTQKVPVGEQPTQPRGEARPAERALIDEPTDPRVALKSVARTGGDGPTQPHARPTKAEKGREEPTPPPSMALDDGEPAPLPQLRRNLPPGSPAPHPLLKSAALAPPPAPEPAPLPRAKAAPARKPPPDHVYESPLQRAIRLEKEGQLGEAIALLEHSIAASKDPAPLYNRLALALIKERRDLATAEELLHKALEHEPENDVYRQNLLKVLTMAASTTNRKRRPKR